MPRFIALRYRGPVTSAPEQILCIVQASIREPSRYFSDVPLLQDLKGTVHGVTK